jgi:DNA polymerase-1
MIRRAFIADPGQSIFSVDYQAVEMRVLAALSGDPALKLAIANGVDLHMYTAEKICGARWQHMDAGERLKMRKIAKVVGLAKVYGGGAAHIADQTGISLEDAKAATAAYDAAFPGIKAYGLRLQREAGWGARPLITHNGRHLPLDRDRTYAATNYSCQSVARDILAGAAIRLDEAGLTSNLLLPIHDEFLGQGPIADVNELAREVQSVMETELLGVHIAADPEVYGDNWGMGYKGPSRELVAA